MRLKWPNLDYIKPCQCLISWKQWTGTTVFCTAVPALGLMKVKNFKPPDCRLRFLPGPGLFSEMQMHDWRETTLHLFCSMITAILQALLLFGFALHISCCSIASAELSDFFIYLFFSTRSCGRVGSIEAENCPKPRSFEENLEQIQEACFWFAVTRWISSIKPFINLSEKTWLNVLLFCILNFLIHNKRVSDNLVTWAQWAIITRCCLLRGWISL